MNRILTVSLLVACAACGETKTDQRQTAATSDVDAATAALFQPLPLTIPSPSNVASVEKIALGRMLYYDTRFSSSRDVSCYVCHPLHDYGVTHRATGVGHNAKVGSRNEPTVYNAAGHIAQFWDGRAADVEAQAMGPVTNPIEMGMADGPAVLAIIESIPGYVSAFKAAFPNDAQAVTFENFGRAIAAFERGLTTPSKWDDYLNGKKAALTSDQKRGLKEFTAAGCAQCHGGAYVGGTMYRKAGTVNPWFNTTDEGRSKITGNDADRMVFKVPALRNVIETWPYFHDGSVQRIDDAVRLMAWHQLGQKLSDNQVQAIVTWLGTLTGSVPSDYIEEPRLPPGKPVG